MNELITTPLNRLLQLIASREISPVEVVKSHLDQIERLNPSLNAVVTLAEDALEQAQAAESELMSGGISRPLLGLPLTIKDTIETAGLRTTSGSSIRRNFVPERDAPAVARLRSAGAIILGKTNAAEMAMDYDAANPVFGRTTNPWDRSMTPGGSSGGEAAAIASFMSSGGLGSDLAGSIRIPAHFCGVAGLKPTTGRIPGEGQFPPSTGPYSLGAVVGPMARTVADLRCLFHVLASGVAHGNVTPGARVAWYADDGISSVTDETVKAVTTAATALRDAGFTTEEVRPPHIDRANEMWLRLFSRASVVQLRNVYKGRESEGGSFVSWRLKTADDTPTPSLDEYIHAWMERDRLRTELVEWLSTTPIIICPVGATPAYAHNTLKVTVGNTTMGTFRAFSYAQAFNVFDLPVVTIPVGKSNEGHPIGVQIAGLPFAEESVLNVAEIVEQAIGWQGLMSDREICPASFNSI